MNTGIKCKKWAKDIIVIIVINRFRIIQPTERNTMRALTIKWLETHITLITKVFYSFYLNLIYFDLFLFNLQ